MTFGSEFLNEPLPERSRQLLALGREYHERTEAYDRLVCTGPVINGGIMSATVDQRILINRNANAVYRELVQKAVSLGFSVQEFRRAVTDTSSRSGKN